MQKSGCLQSITFNRFILLLCGIYIGMIVFIHNRLQTDHTTTVLENDLKLRYEHTENSNIQKLKRWVQTQKEIQQLSQDINQFQLAVNQTRIILNAKKKSQYFDGDCLKYGHENLEKNKFQEIDSGIFVFSAFLDDRKSDVYIRIMTIVDKTRKTVPIFCHTESYSVLAKQYEMCENHNKQYGGYIYSCLLPKNLTVSCPLHVSTKNVRSSSEAVLPVIKVQPVDKQIQFGICISPLFGNIPGAKLIEFIELSKVLGAQKFYFYDNKISDEMKEILNYYMKKGIVETIPWSIPVGENSIWYHGQLIAHNDCLYRTMGTIKYVFFNDIDEFVIPHTNMKYWKDVFLDEFKDQYCGIAFSSAFFDPNLQKPHPSGLQIMGLTSRSKLYSHVRTKVMAMPYRIFEIGIHHISKQNEEKWTVLKYAPEKAFLHHYRKCMGTFGMRCSEYIKDETMFNYYDDVKDEFEKVTKYFHLDFNTNSNRSNIKHN